MQIELPGDLIERANRLAIAGESTAAVFAKAIDRLEWEAVEVAAVQEGMEAYRAGNHRPLEEFGADLRERGVDTDLA